ncbi:MAG: beta-glucosidase [Desulfurococcales archaeon]|nr:beta-glucosidase [Desulfurococcales archaeon]
MIYKVRNGLREGLVTRFYTWHGEKPPEDLESVKPIREEIHPWINYVWWDNPAPGVPSEFFAIMWKGFLYIPRTGEYRFYLTSDDGSRLWIDGQLVIDAWKDQPPTTYVSEPLMFEAGYHRIKYYFYNRYAFAEAVLGWIPPFGEPGVIPREYFKSHIEDSIKFSGLPEGYGVKIVSRDLEKLCMVKDRYCIIPVKWEELPIYARIVVFEKEPDNIVHRSPTELELWGGDEIKIILGSLKI